MRDIGQSANDLDKWLQDTSGLEVLAKVPPTRGDQLSPKKVKKKKKSVDGQGYDPLEQLVADNVDPVLFLDCPENDLLPGSLPVLNENIMELLRSYETCQSMDVFIQQNDTNDKESSNDQIYNPVVSHTNKSTLFVSFPRNKLKSINKVKENGLKSGAKHRLCAS